MPDQTCAEPRTPAPGCIPVESLIFEGGLLRGILTDHANSATLPTSPSALTDPAADTGPAQIADTPR